MVTPQQRKQVTRSHLLSCICIRTDPTTPNPKPSPEEQPVPFANEEQHYKYVNSAVAQYTTEYVEAAYTSSINRTDLNKTSLEANKFLRTIK